MQIIRDELLKAKETAKNWFKWWLTINNNNVVEKDADGNTFNVVDSVILSNKEEKKQSWMTDDGRDKRKWTEKSFPERHNAAEALRIQNKADENNFGDNQSLLISSDGDRQRAAAIQSIAVLLNHRQKQQEEQQKHKQTTNYWKEEEQYIKKYNYYDNSNEPKKSILKGKNFEICEKEVGNDLNIINYSRKSVGEHQRQFSGRKNIFLSKERTFAGKEVIH
uniref:Uncharacterized protein n=1 Tax=Meloidogyne hapla TaxID=6305 RepID=A0A1I8AYC4_MELHA